jgi:hypothetical protein
MALIFNDTLAVTDGSGLYTLYGYVNNSWQDIYTIAGVTDGVIQVNGTTNTIAVDTSVFTAGQTYEFKWIDGNGVESNIRTLDIYALSITGYSAGMGLIDITNTGGDSYTIGFHIAPTAMQSLAGATIVSYDYSIMHWIAGSNTTPASGNETGDYSVAVSGLGAGVYDIKCSYNLSDGSTFAIDRLTKTDGAGNILADIQGNGTTINSVSGLNINATATVVQTAVNYEIYWITIDGSTGTAVGPIIGNPIQAALTPGTTILVSAVGISQDDVFSDYNGDAPGGSVSTIIIS